MTLSLIANLPENSKDSISRDNFVAASQSCGSPPGHLHTITNFHVLEERTSISAQNLILLIWHIASRIRVPCCSCATQNEGMGHHAA